MNTFLPYADFVKSAQCLDYKRLGKQRVEAWQIYQCLTGQGSLRWKNHPAVRMWEGFERTLLWYGVSICEDWIDRGYKDRMLYRFKRELNRIKYNSSGNCFPEWINKSFVNSHRSNLLRKDKKYYSKFNWNVPDNLPYIWPV